MNSPSAHSPVLDATPARPRIQIVEDERIIAMDLKETLESFGYDISGMTGRGDEAIAMAAAQLPDIVLMDINLEGEMNGTEAALRIRQHHRIPVIFLTAYAGDVDLLLAKSSAPYGYLIKPFESRALVATLSMALARRGAERETERSEERLRLALEAGSMVAWEWGGATTGTWVGGEVIGVFGRVPQVLALGPEALLDMIHAEDRSHVAEALASGGALDAEVRMLDGSPAGSRWIELHAKHFPDPSGPGIRVIGVAQDVTERRRLQDRLRNTEAAISATADGIIILDGDRNILSVNSAFCRLTGYVAAEVLGRNPDEFLHARREGDTFAPLSSQMHGGFWRGEIACRRKNGEIFPALQTVSAVTNRGSIVTNFVVSFADISELRRREARISHMALHDALTGLGNRRLLQQRLDGELALAQRRRRSLGFFFLDLDGFKTINDSVGHDAGDTMLKVIAERIEGSIRRSDLAIRIGGDEFLVLMQAHDQAECATLASKLLLTIAAPVSLQGETVSVSCSIGIAVAPADGADGADLIKAADSAMYEAKRSGRNRYAFYTAELAQRARARLLIEQGMRRALAQGEFFLHYQPIINLRDNRVVGFESLARWNHAQAGPVGPAQFIPIAEDTGLIDQLGDYVLRRACTEWMPHLAGSPAELHIAVNVSARQFHMADLADRVERILDETGFPARQLELELTESALQENDTGRGLLERLKRLGVAVAVDDFGTGYSSLSLLNRLPLDTIKIDRSFVNALATDPAATAITRAILAMAQSLGLGVVAEGIETNVQLERLRALGCARGQGYLYSRAVAPAQAAEQALLGVLAPTPAGR